MTSLLMNVTANATRCIPSIQTELSHSRDEEHDREWWTAGDFIDRRAHVHIESLARQHPGCHHSESVLESRVSCILASEYMTTAWKFGHAFIIYSHQFMDGRMNR